MLLRAGLDTQRDMRAPRKQQPFTLVAAEEGMPFTCREVEGARDRLDRGRVLLHEQLDAAIGQYRAAPFAAQKVLDILRDGDEAEVVLAGAPREAGEEPPTLRMLQQ